MTRLPATTSTPPAADEPFVEPRRQDPIYQALKDLGVHEVRVTYSGSGDSSRGRAGIGTSLGG